MLGVFIIACGLLNSCGPRNYVRHLASDASLVVPLHSAKKDVLTFMGQPDQRRTLSVAQEEWIYLQTNKSMLRKTPYLGPKVGSQDYDVVIIVFNDDLVNSCTYRMYNEQEFEESGIKESNPL